MLLLKKNTVVPIVPCRWPFGGQLPEQEQDSKTKYSHKNEEHVNIYKVIYVVISAENVYTRDTGYFNTAHTRGQQTAEMNKQTLNKDTRS